MAPEPRIFAGFVRSTLDTVERADADLAVRVRRRLQPATCEALEQASAVSYVPVEIDVEVTECLFAEAGTTRACEVLRENLSISFETPLLSSLVSGALRLFGRDPARTLRWSSKLWSQLYRDAGAMDFVEETATSGRLELRDLPPCIAASRPYLVGIAAAVEAGFELLQVSGEAQLDRLDASTRKASIRVQWKN